MNPDAHKMTNKPGAAMIVKCSIGATADSDCGWTVPGKRKRTLIVAIGLVQSIPKASLFFYRAVQ
jgi:hypothetical protein